MLYNNSSYFRFSDSFVIYSFFSALLFAFSACEKEDSETTSNNNANSSNYECVNGLCDTAQFGVFETLSECQNNCGTSTYTDPRDGKTYQTIFIDTNEWMAENLSFAPSTGTFWAYNNNVDNTETYGYLYNWQTACTVCPDGWRLPDELDWQILANFLGDNAGGKLKATGNSSSSTGLWRAPNEGATNSSGFNGLPGGRRVSIISEFNLLGSYGYWWSNTERDSTHAVRQVLSYADGSFPTRVSTSKEEGYSVRCVRE